MNCSTSSFSIMWSIAKLLFVLLYLTKLTHEMKLFKNKKETKMTIRKELVSPDHWINKTVNKPNICSDDKYPIFQSIDKLVTADENNEEITEVTIAFEKKTVKYNIYLYSSSKHSITKNNAQICNNTESKSMMLYICLNCMFAEWVQNQLIELVEQIPIRYKTLNLKNYDSILDIDKLKTNIKYIEEKIQHFISLLFNFIKEHSYNAVNSLVDMSLLWILVSTNVLIHNILQHDRNFEVDKTVNNILKIINEAQKFSAYNCDIEHLRYKSINIFNYYIIKPKTDSHYFNIDEFLNQITEFDLDTSLKQCSVRTMLLENMFTSVDDVVKKELKNVKIVLTDNSVLIDEKFFDVIQKSDDLDVIYWYMQVIIDAIIMLFCDKTINELSNETRLSLEIIRGFKILRFLFTELTIDSKDVLEGFKFLMSNSNVLNNNEKSNLKTNMKKYRRIRNSFPENVTIIIPEEPPKHSLEVFMKAIISQISDYECFIYTFEFLTIQRKNNYQFKNNKPSNVLDFIRYRIFEIQPESGQETLSESSYKNTDLSLTPEIQEIMCTLVIDIYECCAEYYAILKWDQNLAELDRKNNNKDVSEIFKDIALVLQYTIENRKIKDRFVIELISDILPVLEMKRDQQTNWEDENNMELIRILYIVMSDLNKYELVACTNNEYENYRTMEYYSNKCEILIKKWIEPIPHKKSFTVSTLPDVNYSLEVFEKIKNLYADTFFIRLYWKGELKTISQIYDNVKFDVLSYYYVNALHDINLKFQMALLYGNLKFYMEYFAYYCVDLDVWAKIKNIYSVNLSKFMLQKSHIPEIFENQFNSCVFEFQLLYETENILSLLEPIPPCKDVEIIIKQFKIDMVIQFPWSNVKIIDKDKFEKKPYDHYEKIILDLEEFHLNTIKLISNENI